MADIDHSIVIGEIRGTLLEFQKHTDRRFDEIREVAEIAAKAAKLAQDKAEKAHLASDTIVKRAGFASGVVSCFVVGIVWIAENIPKAFAAIIAGH